MKPVTPQVPSSAHESPDDTAVLGEVCDVDLPEVARLKDQAASDLRRQKQLAGAAVAAGLAFLMLVYFPSVATLSQLHKRIDNDARKLRTDRERSSLLPQMRVTSARLERDLASFKPFPAASPLNELIGHTSQLGQQLQLRDLRCEPRQEMFDGTLGILPVLLTFEGNFENVYSFIRRCEQMEQPLRVQELRIRQKPAAQANTAPPVGEVTVELLLHAFYEAAEPVAREGYSQ